jgi:hypothetical protein
MKENETLDQLLNYSCEELQLSTTNHEKAVQSYHAVGNWLDAPDSPLHMFSPVIYSQGSFRIGTTNHPIGDAEHDLDFVCEMKIDPARVPAVNVLDLVEARLRAHGTYAPLVERKNRCLRLNYEEFHMDILPAAPEPGRHGTEVVVPDRKLEDWKPSNPRGYAEWFEHRAIPRLDERLVTARVEPMPPMQPAEGKAPLQRAVQLIKRARDRFFAADSDAAPRSIVLTTLAARAYAGQRSTALALDGILTSVGELVARSGQGLDVRNPANPAEILSEKWAEQPRTYREFRRWLDWFVAEWRRVNSPADISDAERHLAVLFGDELAKSTLRRHMDSIEALRRSRDLKVSRAGTLGVVGATTVRPNTFYGA